MSKRGAPGETSARPEATPANAPRSVALQSTIAGGGESLASDLDAPPGTDDDASFLRDVLDVGGAPRLRPGQLVEGAYRVERQLGQGGMGVVFLARDVRLDRQVALKIHRVARRQAGLERLVREARAMARLVHPNVVTVHDVGTIDRDVYVAMEFLDGGTVRQWAATPRPWRAVVELFVQAGRGLAAAHQAGFVHRDFKPDNILLGADGRVRVADFGLVRLLGDGEVTDGAGASGARLAASGAGASGAGTDGGAAGGSANRLPAANSDAIQTLDDRPIVASIDPDDVLSPRRDSATETGTVMGTPAYMAPEQHAGREVGPAADQFAFCVSLWEVLYGKRPFDGDTMAEIVAAVAAGAVHAPPRDRVVPAYVRRVLLRGLAHDPAARYPSMQALLAELAPDPAHGRRRVALASAGAVAFVGLGFGALWLARDREPAVDACAAATTGLDTTWTAADRAAIEHAFLATKRPYALQSFDRVADAFDRFAQRWTEARVASCRATRAGEQTAVADRLRTRCLDGARDELGALVVAFTRADARTLDHALTATSRLPDLARCDDVEVLQQSPLAAAPTVPPAIAALGRAYVEARAAFETGRFKEARAQLDPVIAALPEDGGGDPSLAASVLFLHGQAANAANDMAAARGSLERAARLASAAKDDRMVAQAWTALMEILEKLGKLDEAEGLRAVTEAALARAGNPPRLRAGFLSGLGRLRTNQARYDEARAALTEALALYEADADGALDAKSHALNRLGILEKRAGNFAAARAAVERSLAAQVELRGRKHPFTIATLNNLGTVLLEQGDLAGALALQEEVLASRTEVLGADDPANFSSHTNLGNTYQTLGRYDLAQRHFEAAEKLAFAQPAPRQRWTALHNLGWLMLDRGDAPAAAAQLARALAIGESVAGADNVELVDTLVELADAHVATGAPETAFPLIDRAATLAASKHPAGHPRLARVELSRGGALLAAGRTAAAHERLTAAVTALRAGGPGSVAVLSRALTALARAELARGRAAAAAPLLEEARALVVARLGAQHPRIAEIDRLRARAR